MNPPAHAEIARERFEKWAVNFCADSGLGRREDGSYWDPRTHFAWESRLAAERDTRELDARLLEKYAANLERLEFLSEATIFRRAAAHIRGKGEA